LIWTFLQISLTIVMLLHTSILDLKYREVDPKTWLLYSPLAVFLALNWRQVILPLYLYSFATSVGVSYLFYRFSLIGGADVIAMFLIAISNPEVPSLILRGLTLLGAEPIVVLLYTSLSISVITLYNVFRNLRLSKELPKGSKFKILVSGTRIKVRDFLKSKFMFPLTQVNEDGSLTFRYTFEIDEDDGEWRRFFSELVRQGKISEDSYIWVSWGVPVIPFMLLGYLISVILGFP